MSKNPDLKAISEAAANWVSRHDAGLSESERAEFGQWLAADARHGAAFESYSRAWAALDRPLLAGEQDALMRELRADSLRRQARTRRTRRVQVAIATASAAVVIAFAALWQRHSGDVAVQPLLQQHRDAGIATVTSPEQRVLDDGSTVELRRGAVIDVRYDDAARRVVLVSGEAHFEVAEGLPRPFVVVAKGMEVRAVGTAFVVGLGAEQVEVWVTEGRVAVEKPAHPPNDGGRGETPASPPASADGEDSPTPALAPASASASASVSAPAAGEPVLVATLGVRERVVVETTPWAAAPVVTTVTPDEINERLAWRVSILEFTATPLAEAVALINRHSQLPDGSANARIVLDESLAGMKAGPVSGYFPASDIAAFVEVLHVSMGIESERHGDVIVLRKRENQ